MKFNSLEEAVDCYGRDALVPISMLKQVIFYCRHSVQPKFIWEKEGDPGKITYWFLKSETSYVKRKWEETRPTKGKYIRKA